MISWLTNYEKLRGVDSLKYSLNIQPFDDFWINCWVNGVFSIVNSIEPSFYKAVCMNDYYYKMLTNHRDKTFVHPSVEYYKERYEAYGALPDSCVESLFFKDEDNFLSEVKERLLINQVVLVMVDLFNWIPKSFTYHRYHWHHYSMVTGFDEEKRVFYVFEDDLDGFNMHEVTEDTFIDAFKNSAYYLYPSADFSPAKVINIPDKISPYKIDLQLIIKNAVRLKNEISDIDVSKLWNMGEDSALESYIDFALPGINIISNRHKANGTLFKLLGTESMVDSELSEQFVYLAREIEEGWEKFKKLLGKSQLKKQIDIVKIQGICGELFKKELNMWDFFTQVIK